MVPKVYLEIIMYGCKIGFKALVSIVCFLSASAFSAPTEYDSKAGCMSCHQSDSHAQNSSDSAEKPAPKSV